MEVPTFSLCYLYIPRRVRAVTRKLFLISLQALWNMAGRASGGGVFSLNRWPIRAMPYLDPPWPFCFFGDGEPGGEEGDGDLEGGPCGFY
jgi:hypothetical protein